ncbi:FACT complex subunit SSRP1-like isoform X2 [Mizuhopecten yessoensis]|uniref:TCF3 fusion partner-like n=1 Tax=Mizuhopecten yessoensis TaxID=6573 RepID=A0A210PHC2_MIZYE|nr:FACT complex subunit SSRP1-like isoform X2 [Mizuhopecten yessoensis]OWF35880.1 TCF3 fusion partner-like [Mizuhopecten yessoensis]
MSEGLEAQLAVLANENAFLKKYFSLRKKCEQLQQANEKVVNRIQHVKKLIKRWKRERRYLASKLDEYGDSYQESQVPLMWEEDQIFKRIRPTKNGGELIPDTQPPKVKQERPVADILSSINPILAAHGMAEVGSHGSPTATSSGKPKKAKSDKEKDPSAPKKPANAFLLFCQQQRATVQEAYLKENKEEISNHELTKRLAHLWNSLNPEQKRVFYDLYEQEKERYDREVKEYHEREGSATAEKAASEASAVAMATEAHSAVNAIIMDT